MNIKMLDKALDAEVTLKSGHIVTDFDYSHGGDKLVEVLAHEFDMGGDVVCTWGATFCGCTPLKFGYRSTEDIIRAVHFNYIPKAVREAMQDVALAATADE